MHMQRIKDALGSFLQRDKKPDKPYFMDADGNQSPAELYEAEDLRSLAIFVQYLQDIYGLVLDLDATTTVFPDEKIKSTSQMHSDLRTNLEFLIAQFPNLRVRGGVPQNESLSIKKKLMPLLDSFRTFYEDDQKRLNKFPEIQSSKKVLKEINQTINQLLKKWPVF